MGLVWTPTVAGLRPCRLCAERRTAAEIREWLAPYMKRRNLTDPARVIDGAIYFPSQPIYASKPVIEAGATDPVTGPRSAYLSGLLGEYVTPPELSAPPAPLTGPVR